MSTNVQFTYRSTIEQHSDVLVELSRGIHAASPVETTATSSLRADAKSERRYSTGSTDMGNTTHALPAIHPTIAIDQQREFAETDHEQRSRLLANRTESRSGFVGGTR